MKIKLIKIINSYSNLNNNNDHFSIFNDRAQAAGSHSEGKIQFLIERRHLFEDHLGIKEPLNDLGRKYLFLRNIRTKWIR